ncbi:hypothetical protein ACSRUE_40990 [Sorangium sp. KYC3313]|uniref:hypothetical protein n=1 Tax=unclassified Sorangium TaxID=2621164 RepID=UPI003F5F16BF
MAAFEAIDATSVTERESAEIAGELGLYELELRKPRDAAEHLAWSLERRKALSPAQLRRFTDGLVTAMSFVHTLHLSVDPPDAEVLIDGTPIGAPRRTYTLYFEPGKHLVRARARGRAEGSQGLDAMAKAETTMTLNLSNVAATSAEEGAVASPPKEAAKGSAAVASAARAPGPPASWPGTVRIGGIAVATATAAAGAIFLLRAHVVHGDLREGDVRRRAQGWTSSTCRDANAPAACADIHGQIEERNLFATLGKGSLATSALFGVATAASFFTEAALFGTAPAAGGLRAAPVATAEQAGLIVSGAW